MKCKRTDAVPVTTDLNSPDLNFKMVLPAVHKTSKYYYSKEGQLFIKGDVKFHFKVSFKPTDDSVKFIRLMPVIPNQISKPVRRCENHASKGKNSDLNKSINNINKPFNQIFSRLTRKSTT